MLTITGVIAMRTGYLTRSLVSDGSTLYGMASYGGAYGYGVVFSLPIPPPPAEILLNGTTFSAGNPFSATFQLNDSCAPFISVAIAAFRPDSCTPFTV